VSTLCQSTFFTEYRVYEILFDLWQNNRVSPIQIPESKTRVSAPAKSQKLHSRISPAVASFILAHCIAVAIFLFGHVYHRVFLSKLNASQHKVRHELASAYSDNKIRAATLQLRCQTGTTDASEELLFISGLLLSSDIPQLNFLHDSTRKLSP
jgi:hypothetical protein